MGLSLPSELTEPLGWIGLIWPQADEEKLFDNGQTWIDHGSKLRQQAQLANQTAKSVPSTNHGEPIDAFVKFWDAADGPGQNLENEAVACEVIGAGLIIMAGITLAMKIYFIAQLIALAIEVAQAIATAFVSFGATMAEVPGFVAATRVFCKEALDKIIATVEKEIAKLLEQAKNLFKNVKQLGKEGKQLAKDFKTNPAKALADLKKEFTGRGEYKKLMDEAKTADVSSPKDGAWLYSGKDGNKVPMRNYAENEVDRLNGAAGSNVATTLEKTPGGKQFDDLHLYEPGNELGDQLSLRQKNRIWSTLSERYASGASGEVNSMVHQPWSRSIYLNDELPALQRNPDVTRVLQHDPVPGPDGSLPGDQVFPGGGG